MPELFWDDLSTKPASYCTKRCLPSLCFKKATSELILGSSRLFDKVERLVETAICEEVFQSWREVAAVSHFDMKRHEVL